MYWETRKCFGRTKTQMTQTKTVTHERTIMLNKQYETKKEREEEKLIEDTARLINNRDHAKQRMVPSVRSGWWCRVMEQNNFRGFDKLNVKVRFDKLNVWKLNETKFLQVSFAPSYQLVLFLQLLLRGMNLVLHLIREAHILVLIFAFLRWFFFRIEVSDIGWNSIGWVIFGFLDGYSWFLIALWIFFVIVWWWVSNWNFERMWMLVEWVKHKTIKNEIEIMK